MDGKSLVTGRRHHRNAIPHIITTSKAVSLTDIAVSPFAYCDVPAEQEEALFHRHHGQFTPCRFVRGRMRWVAASSSCVGWNFNIYLGTQPVNHHHHPHKGDTCSTVQYPIRMCVRCPQASRRFIISKGRSACAHDDDDDPVSNKWYRDTNDKGDHYSIIPLAEGQTGCRISTYVDTLRTYPETLIVIVGLRLWTGPAGRRCLFTFINKKGF